MYSCVVDCAVSRYEVDELLIETYPMLTVVRCNVEEVYWDIEI